MPSHKDSWHESAPKDKGAIFAIAQLLALALLMWSICPRLANLLLGGLLHFE